MDALVGLFVAHYRRSDGVWQPLPNHLTETGNLSAGFASKIGLALLGELLGLMHDLGKYAASFQAYLKSAVGQLDPDHDEWVNAAGLKGKIDHSTAGAQYIWAFLRKHYDEKNKSAAGVAQLAALCIASHHSGLIDCITVDGEDNFCRRMAKDDEQSHLTEVSRNADVHIIERAETLMRDPRLLAEVDALMQRIDQLYPTNESSVLRLQQHALMARFIFSCLIGGDRINSADFEHPDQAAQRQLGCYPRWPALVDRLERHLAAWPVRYSIDELRQQISKHCLAGADRPRGIYRLTVPTGGGKTLASLRFALHHAGVRKLDRIIYVIPFTSIIDQNAKVARSILEPADAPEDAGRIVLEQHSNLAPERQTGQEKILGPDWDAPVVYTTMVQLLEALFGSGTRGARRMHQLANAVLVFDEVQTLPVRCVHLFNNAINFLVEHCNSTALLCTATQPLLDQVDPKLGAINLAGDGELMPDVPSLFRALDRVEVHDRRRPGGWSDEDVAELAIDELRDYGSCLVIVNTKRTARALFQLASAKLDTAVLYHLSTSMCPAHRKAELDAIKARLDPANPRPVLCISTQLIEAGVDVDFAVVIRATAGLDSTAQAAGRCNRNGRLGKGRLHVVNLSDESLDALKDIQIAQQHGERFLDDYRAGPVKYENNHLGTASMSRYYQTYFFERKAEMGYAFTADDGQDATVLDLLSLNVAGMGARRRAKRPPPEFPFRHAFMEAAKAFKAIDAPTEGVVVPYGPEGLSAIADLCGEQDQRRDPGFWQCLQQHTVSVHPSLLNRLSEKGAIHLASQELRIYHALPDFYSERFGLDEKVVNHRGIMDVCIQ